MLLELKNICKSFSGVQVLKNVDFDLNPGEVHVLAGENGAGKTTLIKILAGIHTDYEGEIWIDKQFMKFRSAHDASKHGISSIHQEMSLVISMSVEDNIFLGREKTRYSLLLDHRPQRKKALEVLEQLGLNIDLTALVSDYPISIRQMIEIAKALVYDARIIIMDEPTSSLNEAEVARLFDLIVELKKQGYGIIYISHRMEEIYTIGDRISVLRDGEHIGTADADKLSPHELINWMVGREINQQFPDRNPVLKHERLRVDNFSVPDRTLPHHLTVKNATFNVQSGEILGIAGLRGSGKSELLNGLFGTYGRIEQGHIELDDQILQVQSPVKSIQNGIALLTNDRKGTGLIPGMRITRNMSLASLRSFSHYGWMQSDRETEAAEQHIHDFRIKLQSTEQEVQTLSGGNQQKVALAKWLQTQPKVLLLDEPTIGVDVGAKHDIYNLMNEWTSEGIAILLVTSELSELLAMSDRIIVMHRGKITAEFSHEDATQERITKAALGEEVLDGTIQ